jgi:hypothetical protein
MTYYDGAANANKIHSSKVADQIPEKFMRSEAEGILQARSVHSLGIDKNKRLYHLGMGEKLFDTSMNLFGKSKEKEIAAVKDRLHQIKIKMTGLKQVDEGRKASFRELGANPAQKAEQERVLSNLDFFSKVLQRIDDINNESLLGK